MNSYSDLNNQSISLNRESYISEGKLLDNTTRQEIVESWIRSKEAGVIATNLPLPILNEKEAALLDQQYLSGVSKIAKKSESFHLFLDKYNCAAFFFNIDLKVISLAGSRDLLALLNSINIGLGTDFHENIIGTNAVALALSTGKPSFVIGTEHYIDALQNFACCATTYFNANKQRVGAMLITQPNNFTPLYWDVLNLYALLITEGFESLTAEVALNMTLSQQTHGLIFVGKWGLILEVNEIILETLGISKNEILGRKFVEIFPELKSAIDCMKTGKPIYLKEECLRLKQKEIHFYIDCVPCLDDSSTFTGMVVTLYSDNHIRRNVARVINYKAHFVFDDLIGNSSIYIALKKSAKRAAQSNSSILITGESGTGKELVAQAIHNASSRANGPFISVNCAAIPRELIASELFGYMEGAFTGARKGGSLGKFELANKGTIFLDEIGEMPLDMQSMLLRVLEEKEITRLGAHNPVPIDIRVIAATNRDLLKSVDSKDFRLDLYYRLNVIRISIPPLRERVEDIPLLIDHFLKNFNTEKDITKIMPEAMDLLKSYYWPGNIRELRNVIERIINQSDSPLVSIKELPEEILKAKFSSHILPNPSNAYNEKLITEFTNKVNENEQILYLMQKFKGNKARVAKELGMSRVTLYKRLKTLGVNDK